MNPGEGLRFAAGQAVKLAAVPLLSPAEFRTTIFEEVADGARICALWGMPTAQAERWDAEGGPDEPLRLVAVLAHDSEHMLEVLGTAVTGRSYPALTPDCAQAHWFEREIAEQWGVVPEGHPWLKPVRLHLQEAADFFSVAGPEVHEVAVGPVHAGIIEPGHFRFQCHGEEVLHLEISLGYQHRGVERALRGGPAPRSIHLAETAAGDSTVGHALAYCQVLEALSGCRVSPRADALRAIALELERCANHVGDLGALAGDIGYLPTASFCGRLRGDFLNLTARLCGSRFGRGLVRPGGAAFDLDPALALELLTGLERALADAEAAIDMLWTEPTVRARFEQTGVLGGAAVRELGVVGVPARAAGVPLDVRRDFPTGVYAAEAVPAAAARGGDVLARAWVRRLELENSACFIAERLNSLPEGGICVRPGPLTPRSLAVSLTEGWRGEICHAAVTDREGRLACYKIVDPSFHNWFGLALAMRGQPISDFPLCNKSFNLSYCGHDL